MGFIYYYDSVLLLLLLFSMRLLAKQIVTICWQTSNSFTRDSFLMQILQCEAQNNPIIYFIIKTNYYNLFLSVTNNILLCYNGNKIKK